MEGGGEVLGGGLTLLPLNLVLILILILIPILS
jgi:hypothetical protein